MPRRRTGVDTVNIGKGKIGSDAPPLVFHHLGKPAA